MIKKINGLLIILLFVGIFMSCVSIRDHFVLNMLSRSAERANGIFSEKTFPENIIGILDIPYVSDGHRGHLLDIYYPANMEKIYVIGESAGAYLTVMSVIIAKSPRLQNIFNVSQPNININAIALNCGFMEIERKGIRTVNK